MRGMVPLMLPNAVIFDFDGVIASTEDLHLQGYNHALIAAEKELGRRLQITADAYVNRYIVYGSVDGFAHMLTDAGLQPTAGIVAHLCEQKNQFLEAQLGAIAEPLPGIRPLLAFLASVDCICGICSGARRLEIQQLIRTLGLAEHFKALVSADDVRCGKPDPEGYLMAFAILHAQRPELTASQVVVIEDTQGGAMAAKSAGFRVLGVATTSPIESVRRWANWAIPDLSHLDYAIWSQWLEDSAA